jgi:excisionase family DNA binding protein
MTELLTPHQAAERLQISERTLMEHVKAQDLAAIHIGRGRLRRRLRFDPADLKAFSERRKAETRELTGGALQCQSLSTPRRRSTTMLSNTKVANFMALRAKLRDRKPGK